jgi:hypothetical protein
MSIYKKILVTLILLANASLAMAQIYKCDGPEGPVYSDTECEPNAATVDVLESSGLTGISDEELSELAEKKSDRDQARNRNTEGTVIENQSTIDLTTYNDGRSVRGRDQLKQRIDSGVPAPLPAAQPRPRPRKN